LSDYVLWHNPRCSKSRSALELLREHGVEPRVRDYLEQPPDIGELHELLHRLQLPVRDLLRGSENEYAELGLGDPSLGEHALLAAMAAHPRLIQRPVLVVGERAVIGRPPERVLELLP
jgi:arsenate reductase